MTPTNTVETSDINLKAPMACLVVAMLVDVGQRVHQGDPLCITETMKCESTLLAPGTGWVQSVLGVGTTVDAGDDIIVINPTAPGPKRRLWHPNDVQHLLTGHCAQGSGSNGSDPDHGVELPEVSTGKYTPMDLIDGALAPARAVRAVRDGRTRSDQREASLTVGIVSHQLRGHPSGLRRVLICGDPSSSMGAVAEAECRLVIAAIEYAACEGLSIEWVAISAGARIAWDSGTENMDWCAEVARHIVEFTQAGGAINVIVAGVNVGAQSYWNALATMLWHCSGCLIMLEDQSMVLTGRRALALSGGAHHDHELVMGGYADVMGPNGEAHHVASDLPGAYRILFDHLALCEPTEERTPPRSDTIDDPDRSLADAPYSGPGGFTRLSEVLDAVNNPTRKRAFAIRPVMAALADLDAERLDRWADMAGSHPAVVWDTRIGGHPVSLIGIESQPIHDSTLPAAPLRASGTLYPQASRKVARALNAASGRRGAVVLANLAGFDGSAESMLGRQLEYGAEIARAVVNFRGPLVVVVIGRFHGGAYVVFSRRLNPSVSILALEGTYVSVIGGDAAAGVVFARDVQRAVETTWHWPRIRGSPTPPRRSTVNGTNAPCSTATASPGASTPSTASTERPRSGRWTPSSPPTRSDARLLSASTLGSGASPAGGRGNLERLLRRLGQIREHEPFGLANRGLARLGFAHREVQHRIHGVHHDLSDHRAFRARHLRRERRQDPPDPFEELLLVDRCGVAGRVRRLHREPHEAARRIREPRIGEMVDHGVEQLGPIRGRDLLGEAVDLGRHRLGVEAIEFAHDRELVGEELIERADRKSGVGRDRLTGEGLKAGVQQQLTRRFQNAREPLSAPLLHRSTPGLEVGRDERIGRGIARVGLLAHGDMFARSPDQRAHRATRPFSDNQWS